MIKKLKSVLSSKRGDGYIDVVIGTLCIVMFLALSLNVFSVITLKTKMDRIAEDLLDVATYTGAFDTVFNNKVTQLKEQYFDFEVEVSAERYFNAAQKRVQLGDRMTVTITVNTALSGGGTVIPMTVSVQRSGESEQYWKPGS